MQVEVAGDAIHATIRFTANHIEGGSCNGGCDGPLRLYLNRRALQDVLAFIRIDHASFWSIRV